MTQNDDVATIDVIAKLNRILEQRNADIERLKAENKLFREHLEIPEGIVRCGYCGDMYDPFDSKGLTFEQWYVRHPRECVKRLLAEKDAEIALLKKESVQAEAEADLLREENERFRKAGENSEAAWLALDDDYTEHGDPWAVVQGVNAEVKRLKAENAERQKGHEKCM